MYTVRQAYPSPTTWAHTFHCTKQEADEWADSLRKKPYPGLVVTVFKTPPDDAKWLRAVYPERFGDCS